MTPTPRRAASLAAIVGTAIFLAACNAEVSLGEKVIDRHTIELESMRSLEAETGQKPASVDCPEDLKAEVDESRTCELVDQNGNRYDMKVTVVSVDEDGNATFNIEVGQIKGNPGEPS